MHTDEGDGEIDHSTGDTARTNRKVRASISNAIRHLETVESGLEPFDTGKNREARKRLEDALERLRERDGGIHHG